MSEYQTQDAEELFEVTADIVRRLSSGSMRILIQAPDFIGISTFTNWSFPDIVFLTLAS